MRIYQNPALPFRFSLPDDVRVENESFEQGAPAAVYFRVYQSRLVVSATHSVATELAQAAAKLASDLALRGFDVRPTLLPLQFGDTQGAVIEFETNGNVQLCLLAVKDGLEYRIAHDGACTPDLYLILKEIAASFEFPNRSAVNSFPATARWLSEQLDRSTPQGVDKVFAALGLPLADGRGKSRQ